MRKVHPDRFEQLQLAYACGTCGAEPGVWCKSKHPYYLHNDRYLKALPEINDLVDAERQTIRDRADAQTSEGDADA